MKISIKNDMKILLFEHNDLDGITNNIILKTLIPNANIKVIDCNYDDINNKVQYYLPSFHKYDVIFITDISINYNLAKIIDNTNYHVILLDHHKTALKLNDFNFCNVFVELNNKLTCGSELFYNYLINHYKIFKNHYLFKFIEIVRQYDTWEWKKLNNEIPKQYNDIFNILGKDLFVNEIINKINNKNLSFNDIDKLLLKINKEKQNKYFKLKDKQLIKKQIMNYNTGIVFANQYLSELGNYLLEHNDIDISILIGENSISYRSKDDVDCSQIAKMFNGGGHKNAAGSSISEDNKMKYIDILFSNQSLLKKLFK